MPIGRKVYQLRIKRRLSQAELAERAGVTQGVISRMEAQERYNATAEVLKALAQALGCTTDYLVGMHEEEEPPRLRRRGKRASA